MEQSLEHLAVYALLCCAFFLILYFSLRAFRVERTVACCIVSMIHHIIVTFYCIVYNYSYMDILHDSFKFGNLSCDTLQHSTPPIYYSGIFTITYLAFDCLFDLSRNVNSNKLLIFHHINGVGLVSYALYTHYGEYMVYICHIMELSSIFLSLKGILKYFDSPSLLKLINDAVFAVSFLVVRVYTTLASVLIIVHMYRNNCLESIKFLDILIAYTTLLYVLLTTFWSYGIVNKVISTIKGSDATSVEKKNG